MGTQTNNPPSNPENTQNVPGQGKPDAGNQKIPGNDMEPLNDPKPVTPEAR